MRATLNSAAVFLHDVYEREIERHNKRMPADNDAFYALFSREMRELMQAPRLPNPREPIGPILHALFGRGVLPGTEVIFGGVRTTRSDDGIAMLDVTLTVRGEVRELTVILLRQEGAWRIHQIGLWRVRYTRRPLQSHHRPVALTICEK